MEKIIHASDILLGLSYESLIGTPESIINLIRKKYTNTYLFIINVNFQAENISRSQNAGILLLKYLRLYRLRQHCVLYSFLSREQLILQNPDNLIIFSKGVTFVRLPENLNNLNFEKLAKDQAPEDLSRYFKVGFNMPEDNRHNWANWWGIERLWQVHQAVIGKNKEDINGYISSPFIKKMRLIEALIAQYLYPINKNLIKEAEKDSKLEKLISERNTKALLIKNNPTYGNKRFSDEIILKLRKEIDTINTEITKIKIHNDTGSEIKILRDKIAQTPKNIVLIDDQSSDGWEIVFKNMLYHDTSGLYFYLNAPAINNTNTCLQHITESTDIVLLDLRLKNEQGSMHDVSQLSGVVLLKKIIERYPGIPVIVITASNKFRSYQTIMDLGADAYWVKEGLDSRFNEKETFENYRHFLELIMKLSGGRYKLLKHFSRCVNQIKKSPTPWWINQEWSNPDGNPNQNREIKSKVIELLDYGVMLYRNWLKMFELNSDVETINEAYSEKFLANIVNTLGGIVELIHVDKWGGFIRIYEIGAKFHESNCVIYRGDFLGFYIYCMRNTGSHISGTQKINFDFFEFYIKILLTWLSVDYIKINIDDVGIRNTRDFKSVVNNPEKIILACKNMILTKVAADYKYSQYANFYEKKFK